MATARQQAWLDEMRAERMRDGLQWALDSFRRYPHAEAVERVSLKIKDLQQVIDHAREVRTNGG